MFQTLLLNSISPLQLNALVLALYSHGLLNNECQPISPLNSSNCQKVWGPQEPSQKLIPTKCHQSLDNYQIYSLLPKPQTGPVVADLLCLILNYNLLQPFMLILLSFCISISSTYSPEKVLHLNCHLCSAPRLNTQSGQFSHYLNGQCLVCEKYKARRDGEVKRALTNSISRNLNHFFSKFGNSLQVLK